MSTPTPNAVGPGSAASPRSSMLPPNIFDPRTDGSDYYFYVTNIASALAPAAQTASQIQIDAGTDFYWIATTAQVDDGSQVVSDPFLTVIINDTGASRNLMNAALPLGEITADFAPPYRLVRPRLFRANSVVNFTWTNYSSGATYQNVYMVLHGYRRLVQAPGLVA